MHLHFIFRCWLSKVSSLNFSNLNILKFEHWDSVLSCQAKHLTHPMYNIFCSFSFIFTLKWPQEMETLRNLPINDKNRSIDLIFRKKNACIGSSMAKKTKLFNFSNSFNLHNYEKNHNHFKSDDAKKFVFKIFNY